MPTSSLSIKDFFRDHFRNETRPVSINLKTLECALSYPAAIMNELLYMIPQHKREYILTQHNDAGSTLMHAAAYEGVTEIMNVLLRHKADVDVFDVNYLNPLCASLGSQNSFLKIYIL